MLQQRRDVDIPALALQAQKQRHWMVERRHISDLFMACRSFVTLPLLMKWLAFPVTSTSMLWPPPMVSRLSTSSGSVLATSVLSGTRRQVLIQSSSMAAFFSLAKILGASA